MTAHDSAISNCQQPRFICQDGYCDIDVLEQSTAHLSSRLNEILSPVKAELHPARAQSDIEQIITSGRNDVTVGNSAIIPLQSDVWNGIEPINYRAEIQVGTPTQKFWVDLDTGSSLLWLQSSLADDAGQSNLSTPQYAPKRSSSSLSLDRETSISYGDGSHVTASLFTDSVTAGLLTAEAQLVGAAATGNIKDEFRSRSSDGMLGLGFPILSDLPQDEADRTADTIHNFVQNLQQEGKVKYASMTLVGPRNDPKLAARIDQKATMLPRGNMIIGSVDPSFYTGTIAWCPRLTPDRWIVTLDEVQINGLTVARRQKALIDTGTAYIVASPINYDKVVQSIAGAKPWSKKAGRYFTFPKTNLNTVSFVLGGRTFKLFPQDFGLGKLQLLARQTTPLPDGDAIINAQDDEKSIREVSSIIRLDSWPFEDDLWIIGGIFMDNIVTIFDFATKSVGFADISEDDLVTESAQGTAELKSPESAGGSLLGA